MTHPLLISLMALLTLVPGGVASAATTAGESLILAEPSTENTYLAGAHVAVTAPVGKDLLAAGGVVEIDAPIEGDVLAIAGTLSLQSPVAGDVRAAGSRVSVRAPVVGDLALMGASIEVAARSNEIFAVGGRVTIAEGASGNVRLYATDITLGGVYDGDVHITASNSFTLLPDTRITGRLVYDAPERVELPEGVSVVGGAVYNGSYSYLPTREQAERYALLGGAVFVIVRALAGMIAAGLIMGLFPRFVRSITTWLEAGVGSRAARAGLLGIAVLLVTPILLILLFISFVGAVLGFILLSLYVLLLLLAHTFSGILVGALVRRYVLSRMSGSSELTWRDAILGSLVLSVLVLVPVIGIVSTLLFTLIALGAISCALYRATFHD